MEDNPFDFINDPDPDMPAKKKPAPNYCEICGRGQNWSYTARDTSGHSIRLCDGCKRDNEELNAVFPMGLPD